jgi:predicted RNA binding protein YcfA (HicA-like mRNA interferase family)
MKVKEAVEILAGDGWYLHSTKGSHRQFKHPVKKGRVTVAGKLSRTCRRASWRASCVRPA